MPGCWAEGELRALAALHFLHQPGCPWVKGWQPEDMPLCISWPWFCLSLFGGIQKTREFQLLYCYSMLFPLCHLHILCCLFWGRMVSWGLQPEWVLMENQEEIHEQYI
jgi:hypothetical protein